MQRSLKRETLRITGWTCVICLILCSVRVSLLVQVSIKVVKDFYTSPSLEFRSGLSCGHIYWVFFFSFL